MSFSVQGYQHNVKNAEYALHLDAKLAYRFVPFEQYDPAAFVSRREVITRVIELDR